MSKASNVTGMHFGNGWSNLVYPSLVHCTVQPEILASVMDEMTETSFHHY